jgi:cytochrome P450
VDTTKTLMDFLMLDPELIADPYPMYKHWREREPVQWAPGSNAAVAWRYADVSAVLRDARFSADRMPDGSDFSAEYTSLGPTFALVSSQMLFRDPPDHTRLRGLVSAAFTPRMIEHWRGTIQTQVESILDAALAAGGMDVIQALAYPLPTTVIAMMLGIPPEDRADFKRWSDDFALFLGTNLAEAADALMQSAMELIAYLQKHIARRTGDEDDVLGAMLRAREGEDRLSETELYANIILLLAAGHETTTNLIGNGTLALLRHPDQWQLLRQNPALVTTAVEEFLRYDSPVQFTSRLAKVPVMLGDVEIPAGVEVMTILGSANRDPAQFPDPDEVHIDRRENKHVAFGFGSHFCLGAPLARLEGQIAFEALARRLPEHLTMLDAHPPRLGNAAFRGLESLRVAW